MSRIPLAGPSITELEISYVTEAARVAWYDNANLYQSRFEAAFAAYTGRAHAISLPHCTSGIHLALAALGVGPGDEVIVPELTWIATASPITYTGATPVFADCDPETWCLSPDAFEACINERTRAVIPVGLYGGLPPMDQICAIADRHGIPVVEDAAESLGSRYQDRLSGAWGRVGLFSFHGSKTLSTGEGGMFVTDDTELFERASFLRDHGRRPGDTRYLNEEAAFKYKMTAFQAAVGLAQLERIEELIQGKRRIFEGYRDRLSHVEGLELNPDLEGLFNTCWLMTVRLDDRFGVTKETVVDRLAERQVDSRPFFYPLSSLPAFAGSPGATEARIRNVRSYEISRGGINLPTALNLTDDQV
ncbi:MAG: DegT/DnrJ/EryC1/StrS family aminotransferase, partial [Myxococcota bacterium]|nr:DegT/DnrJ/EryC1/StrS family aminotransferase [Myxococcota bacterium]